MLVSAIILKNFLKSRIFFKKNRKKLKFQKIGKLINFEPFCCTFLVICVKFLWDFASILPTDVVLYSIIFCFERVFCAYFEFVFICFVIKSW